MTLTGCLTELSLPEIFWILEQGRHSGLLTLCTPPESATQTGKVYYIWLCQGRIVAASDSLAHLDLLSLVSQNRGMDELSVPYPMNIPMGEYLSCQGLIEPLQLQQLLQEQVKQPVSDMFQVTEAAFEFEPKAPLPLSIMTGLSLSIGEVTLQGLRMLTDWNHLKHKLPDPTSALLTVCKARRDLKLDPWEWQVWEFADGKVSLDAIAWQTGLPLQKVRQIAFRLIVAGLAKGIRLGLSDLIEIKPRNAGSLS